MGIIEFTLYAPGGAPVWSESGQVDPNNRTASTPTGYIPTQAGTYEWVASYPGDGNNNPVSGNLGDEPEAVTQIIKASPTISTAAGSTVVLGSSLPLTDSATLAGGNGPTGTITFTLAAPGGAIVDTETANVNGNGTYSTPTGYVPSGSGTLAGTYQWEASYSGDSNNNPVASPAGSEPETVNPASPTITTVDGGTVVLGNGVALSDSATLANGFVPTGTITFMLTAPSGLIVDTEKASVNGNGTYRTPNGYVPSAAGTYQWQASYSGDPNNNPVASPAGSEPETVNPASPTLTTTPGGPVVLGSSVRLTDSAALAGGYSPGGTITFTLYAPGGAAVDTETASVNANGTYNTSTGYLPRAAGTYQWVASYGGDGNNNPVASPAGSEPETVNPASPTLTTTPGGPVVLGSGVRLTDSATLAGGYSPGGTITFTLYAPGGAAVDTETASVNANSMYTTLTGYLPTAAGTYQWVASYGGDGNNNPVSGNSGDEPETVTPLVKANPTISTTPGPTVVLGSGVRLMDSATIGGGNNPTGTLRFMLTNPGGSLEYTEIINVNGNGTYNTTVGLLPSVITGGTGTYQWEASYGGDSNNNPVASPAGSEPETVNPASPTITTVDGGTVVLGNGVALSDSATLAGGYNPGRSITFTLFAPGGLIVDKEIVGINGNGTYATPTGYLPSGTGTLAGTYQWEASYGGDGYNNPVASPVGSEPEIVNVATPTISTTFGGPVVLGSGARLTDSATLAGAYNPGGTITFTLYAPGGAAVDTETASVNANGTYSTPTGYLPTAAGTYQWVASYGGDGNNNPVSGNLGDEPETVTPPIKANPTISTTPGPTVVLGSGVRLTDSATIAGGNNPTGTITFMLASPGGGIVDTETVSVTGNGTYSTPTGYAPSGSGSLTGTYQWEASYGGDAINNPVASPAGSEPEIVNVALPTISTTPGGSVVLGSGARLTDSATLAGGYNPTGTIIFTLYAPGDLIVDNETVNINGNGTYATPTGYLPSGTGTLAGTYHWRAAYSGDANNMDAGSGGFDSEPETVAPASPTLTTTPGGPVVLGSGVRLTDSATLAGGYNPTGTLTFTLYAPGGAAVDTETATVNANGTYSTPTGYLPTAAGTYQWVAKYGGDGNNNPAGGNLGDEPETVSANSKASPTLTTAAGPTVVIGSGARLTDSATLAGGTKPTGTVTFTLAAPGGGTVLTETIKVSGNGFYKTSTGYLPSGTGTLTGTYQWSASYSGDTNNNTANDQGGVAEQTVVSKASPTLKTTASPAITLDTTAPTLRDAAALSAGYAATGSLAFTLKLGTTTVYTTNVPVNGNGPYNASYTLPTSAAVTGTYTWSVSYAGDGNNNAASDQGGATEQTVVSQASPKITTNAGPAVVVGSGAALTDSANLTGGYNPTGSLTFTLTAPGGTVVSMQTVTVSGNGVYKTPSGYTPNGPGTLTGAYQWQVSYSGDTNNKASSPGSESETVKPATPKITTTAGPAVGVGSGQALTDSATLAGGYTPSGSLTFTLTSPTGAIVDTETVPVTGDAVYKTPNGYVPSGTGVLTGTYHWVASYGGDGNNNGVASAASGEPEMVKPASPTLTTTAGPTVILGSSVPLTASTTLAGGYSTTGNVTFTLTAPGGTTVDTETATISGNGVYKTPTGYLATAAGTYQWVASYGGDGNNKAVTSARASEIVKPSGGGAAPNPGTNTLGALNLLQLQITSVGPVEKSSTGHPADAILAGVASACPSNATLRGAVNRLFGAYAEGRQSASPIRSLGSAGSDFLMQDLLRANP
jgi:hypothetical protein